MIGSGTNSHRNDNVMQFIDTLDGKKHVALIYDDPDYAKLLKFRFIKNGLQNGENCVYITHEDSGKAVIDMITYGIQIKYFQTNKIVVYHHQNRREATREEIEKNAKKNIETIRSSLAPPYRIVGRVIPNVECVDGMAVQLEIEKKTHEKYNDFGGIIMCAYDINKIEKTKRKKWIAELHRNHHHTISISAKNGNAVFTLT